MDISKEPNIETTDNVEPPTTSDMLPLNSATSPPLEINIHCSQINSSAPSIFITSPPPTGQSRDPLREPSEAEKEGEREDEELVCKEGDGSPAVTVTTIEESCASDESDGEEQKRRVAIETERKKDEVSDIKENQMLQQRSFDSSTNFKTSSLELKQSRLPKLFAFLYLWCSFILSTVNTHLRNATMELRSLDIPEKFWNMSGSLCERITSLKSSCCVSRFPSPNSSLSKQHLSSSPLHRASSSHSSNISKKSTYLKKRFKFRSLKLSTLSVYYSSVVEFLDNNIPSHLTSVKRATFSFCRNNVTISSLQQSLTHLSPNLNISSHVPSFFVTFSISPKGLFSAVQSFLASIPNTLPHIKVLSQPLSSLSFLPTSTVASPSNSDASTNCTPYKATSGHPVPFTPKLACFEPPCETNTCLPDGCTPSCLGCTSTATQFDLSHRESSAVEEEIDSPNKEIYEIKEDEVGQEICKNKAKNNDDDEGNENSDVGGKHSCMMSLREALSNIFRNFVCFFSVSNCHATYNSLHSKIQNVRIHYYDPAWYNTIYSTIVSSAINSYTFVCIYAPSIKVSKSINTLSLHPLSSLPLYFDNCIACTPSNIQSISETATSVLSMFIALTTALSSLIDWMTVLVHQLMAALISKAISLITI